MEDRKDDPVPEPVKAGRFSIERDERLRLDLLKQSH